MAKTVLGIDIGYDNLKLAIVNGRRVLKVGQASMPEKLMKEGRIVSVEAMGELLKETMKQNSLHCSKGGIVLTGPRVFVRNVTMPQMSTDQLIYNLPYEFRDYITDELRDYAFDYAMISTREEMTERRKAKELAEAAGQMSDSLNGPQDNGGMGFSSNDEYKEEGGSSTMDLMAAAVPKQQLEEAREILRRGGLKMVKAAPSICAYSSLIRNYEAATGQGGQEYCILDLGYQSIRMHVFRGENHMVTRELETGLSVIDNTIAEVYNVDVHLAHTYLMTNHDNCQEKDVCVNTFTNISVELMRALNFYRFSNQDSVLTDVWLCGGGAAIESLRVAIVNTLDMDVHPASELVMGGSEIPDCNTLIQAIGIAQDV